MAEENLTVHIDARDRASATLQRLGRTMEQTNQRAARATDDLAESTARLSNRTQAQIMAIGQGSRSFVALERELGKVNRLQELGVVQGERYAQILQQISDRAQELQSRGVEPMGRELEAFRKVMRATGQSASQGTKGFGILRRSMGSLAARAAGLNGRIGTVLSSLSGFAVSSLTAAGVFAGVAALGLAFKGLREDAKDAAEEVENFIKQFDPLAEFIEKFGSLDTAIARRAELERERQRILAGGDPSQIDFELRRGVSLRRSDEEGVGGLTVEALQNLNEVNQELGPLARAIDHLQGQLGDGSEAAKKFREGLADLTPPLTTGLDRMVASLEVAAPVIDDHADRLKRATEALELPFGALPEGPRRAARADMDVFSRGMEFNLPQAPEIQLDRVNRRIRLLAAEFENNAGDSFERLQQVAIAGVGGITEAWARGAANMEQIAVNAFTRIAQAAAIQKGNDVLGAIIGVAGGIIGGLFSRNNRPTPVRVEDYSTAAERKMKDANEQPVVRNVFAFPDGSEREPTDEELRQLGYLMARLMRKGAIPRG